MKYIKTYEENNNKPKIGDYVVVDFGENKTDLGRMLEKQIGKVLLVKPNFEKMKYTIKFGTVNFNIDHQDILDFSENEKDLEHYIKAKKYNI